MTKKEDSFSNSDLQDVERRRFLGGVVATAGVGILASLGASATPSVGKNRIVITTPTGNIGSQILETMVASGAPIRVIERNPSRIPATVRSHIEIIQGSHSDPAVVDEAFQNTDTVFCLCPPDTQAQSAIDAYVDFTRPACQAILRHGVRRVISVSALGRNTPFAANAGYVTASLAMDDLIASTGVNFRALTMSRPFRTTDHEPEIMYVYPTTYSALGNWQVRYMSVGAAHHSNGESEPLSRSWNRVYLMSGAELDDRFQINAGLWKRISEDSENDDNPDIANYIGRAEITGRWNYDLLNTFDATLRNNLRSDGRGSLRLEWFRTIGDSDSSNLRLHTQLFHGYGDTLIEYNRRRTVFSIGLSLVDF